MTRHGLDEALLGAIIKDLLPQRTWVAEVLLADLGEERDGGANEVAVGLVKVDAPVAELNRLDRGEIAWSTALVVKGHGAVTLEVGEP